MKVEECMAFLVKGMELCMVLPKWGVGMVLPERGVEVCMVLPKWGVGMVLPKKGVDICMETSPR